MNTRLEAPVGHIEVDVAVKQAQRGAEIGRGRPPFEQEEFGPTAKNHGRNGEILLRPHVGPHLSQMTGLIFGHRVGFLRCLESLWSWSKGLQCRCPRSWELHGDSKQFDWEAKLILHAWICNMFGDVWMEFKLYIILRQYFTMTDTIYFHLSSIMR